MSSALSFAQPRLPSLTVMDDIVFFSFVTIKVSL